MMGQEVLPVFSAAAKSIQPHTTYQHYKGLCYKILAIARHSETLEEMVIYQALYGEGAIWARPVSLFLGDVVVDGRSQARFKRKAN
jgi:hypothetical protein